MKSIVTMRADHTSEIKESLTMAVNAVIAEFLSVEIDKTRPDVQLGPDLGMSPVARKRLQRELAFVFDTTEIDIIDSMTVSELVGQVANVELPRLTGNRRAQPVL